MGQMHDLAQIHELARQMARTGQFCSWRLIAIELRFMQGVREAADGFSDPAIREELDTLCRAAQKRKARHQPVTAMTSVPAIPRPAQLPPMPRIEQSIVAARSAAASRPQPTFLLEPAPRWVAKYRA